MYYQKFINFLISHNLHNESVLNYWKKNKVQFDYLDIDQREFIGCYFIIIDKKLKQIKIRIPYINDDKTVLINIHEYVHLLLTYPYLNKKIKLGLDKEVLPIYYEKVYINENKSEYLSNYSKYLDQKIIENNQKEYTLALELSEVLLKENNISDIYQQEKKVKRLIKHL